MFLLLFLVQLKDGQKVCFPPYSLNKVMDLAYHLLGKALLAGYGYVFQRITKIFLLHFPENSAGVEEDNSALQKWTSGAFV